MIKNELLKRNLPDVLTDCSGKTISSKEEWDKVQCPYWKNLLLQEEYGVIPSLLVPQITKEEFYIDFGGKAVWENITFHFEKRRISYNKIISIIKIMKQEIICNIIYMARVWNSVFF